MARRVLIVSDRHPSVSDGIGPLAAHRLFAALEAEEGVESYFLAAADHQQGAPLGVAMFQPFGAREYLIATHGYDAWLGANTDGNFPEQFEILLRRIEPDIIHFQSWAAIGIEAIAWARRILPQARIGVALRAPVMMPVSAEGLSANVALQAAVARRFPGRTRNDVLLRWLFQRRFLLAADAVFVDGLADAVSAAGAGLPEERIHIVPPTALSNAIGVARAAGSELIVGVFGLDSLSDGGELLGRAAKLFANDARVRFEIQPVVGFGEADIAGEAPMPVLAPIAPADIAIRMEDCHIVLIPGQICEHAAIFVQEARAARRPVMCPVNSLAASYVRDRVDGFHFTPSGAALAEIVGELLAQPDLAREAQERVGFPFAQRDAAAAMLAIYDGAAEAADEAAQ